MSKLVKRLPAARSGDLMAAGCETRVVLEHLTSRWGVLVMLILRERTHRFSELGRRIGGVSEKMLAQTLQALTDDGFVSRKVHPVVPPHVEYTLTPLGEEVCAHIVRLTDWIEDNVGRVVKARATKERRARAAGA